MTPWTATHQASLSFTISQSLLELMPIESVMPSPHLILCRPLLLLPSLFPIIRVFSNESVLFVTWPKYWSFSFSISPSNEYSVSGGLEVTVKLTGQLQSYPEHPGAPLWLFLSPPSAFSSLASAPRLFSLHMTFSCHGPDSSSPHHSSLNFTLNSFFLCLS